MIGAVTKAGADTVMAGSGDLQEDDLCGGGRGLLRASAAAVRAAEARGIVGETVERPYGRPQAFDPKRENGGSLRRRFLRSPLRSELVAVAEARTSYCSIDGEIG